MVSEQDPGEKDNLFWQVNVQRIVETAGTAMIESFYKRKICNLFSTSMSCLNHTSFSKAYSIDSPTAHAEEAYLYFLIERHCLRNSRSVVF
jgi:hypothetical protein